MQFERMTQSEVWIFDHESPMKKTKTNLSCYFPKDVAFGSSSDLTHCRSRCSCRQITSKRTNVLVLRLAFNYIGSFTPFINDTPSSPSVSQGTRCPVLLFWKESVSAAVQKVCKLHINGGKKAHLSHCDNKPKQSSSFPKLSVNRQQPGEEEGAGEPGTNCTCFEKKKQHLKLRRHTREARAIGKIIKCRRMFTPVDSVIGSIIGLCADVDL